MTDYSDYKVEKDDAGKMARHLLVEILKNNPEGAVLLTTSLKATQLGRGIARAYFELKKSLETGRLE